MPVALLVGLLGLWGCHGNTPLDRVLLWTDEAEWVQWPDGWAQAVAVDAPRTFGVAPGVDRFRAVALPMADPTDLRLTVGGEDVTRRIDGPTPLDLDLGSADSVTLTPGGGVYLLRPRMVSSTRQGRRILLVVADTLRYDHATPELMPEVHRYFEGGLHFLQAHSAAAWTLPSVAAIFTGQVPARLRSPDGVLISLPTGTPTIASELARRGYASVAVTANYTVHHENRYSTGFDLFLVPDPKAGQFADAAWLNRQALDSARWLDDEDLFLYLQYMEPHDPYRDHEAGGALKPPPTGSAASEAGLAALRQAYASEVRHLSRQLDALLPQLGELDLAIFTSDHGEEIGDHGGFRHGLTLFEESVHVPLLVRGRGIEAQTIAEPVSLVDLKDFILSRHDTAWPTDAPVTAEGFGFGPPRWSQVQDTTRVIYSAVPIEPQPPEHPSERWLRATHPRVAFTRLDDASPVDPDGPMIERSLRGLVDHFAGFRRGVYVLVRQGAAATLSVRGAGRDGLIWGAAEQVEVTAGVDGSLRVEVASADPFALVFLPVENDVTPEYDDPESVTVWFDQGPPERKAAEVGETLQRLKALGYI